MLSVRYRTLGLSTNLGSLGLDHLGERLFLIRAQRRHRLRGGASSPDRSNDRDGAGQQCGRRRKPQHRGLPLEARLEQNELAIARDQEIYHLWIAVAGGEPLAYQDAQVARERRFRIVDRLV